MQSAVCWVTVALVLQVSSVAEPWDEDYGAALTRARQEGKPVLVVIGEGADGWRQLVSKGWSPVALRLASEHFLCVYVNARDGGYGTTLARSFGVRQLPALVISDRFGRIQAFRREGTLSNAELQTILAGHIPSRSAQLRPTSFEVPAAGGSRNGPNPVSTPAVLCPT